MTPSGPSSPKILIMYYQDPKLKVFILPDAIEIKFTTIQKNNLKNLV